MNKQEKNRLEEKRKQMSLKTMYFNRFLLVRYITAVFFFLNLYWFFSLVLSGTIWSVVPGITLLIIIKAIYEQFTLSASDVDDAKCTGFLFKLISIINLLVLIIVIPTALFNQLFPFLTNSITSRRFIIGITLIGLAFCVVILKRLYKIKNRTDKQLQRVKQYEQAIK